MANITSTDQSTFQRLLANDPEIQAVIRSVWGNTPAAQRPGDTPKNLEQANDAASKRIAQILASRGVQLPSHTFINPRTESLEGQRGWAGLPTSAKIAIIGGLAATGVGAAGAMGAFGGGAAASGAGAGAASSTVPGIATTAGLPSMAGIGTTVGAAGTAIPGAATAATSGLAGAGTLASRSLTGAGTLASRNLTSAAPLVDAAAKTGDQSFLSKIGSLVGSKAKSGVGGLIDKVLSPNGLQAIGTGMGAVSQADATNRGAAIDAMIEGDKNKMAARTQRSNEESDLWRKIQAANYMKSGGTPKSDSYSSTGFKLPSFGFGPAPISDADKQMASTLLPQLQDRLNNPLQLGDYNSKIEPGKTEKTLDWLGPILNGAGTILGGKK